MFHFDFDLTSIATFLAGSTGLVWCLERSVINPIRKRLAIKKHDQFVRENREALINGDQMALLRAHALEGKIFERNRYIRIVSNSFFFFAFVYVIVAFICEPVLVKDDKMLPNVQAYDVALVMKMGNGFQVPGTEYRFMQPDIHHRGEVVAYYDENRNVKISRIIAFGGDKISYSNKRFYVNDVPLGMKEFEDWVHPDTLQKFTKFTEISGPKSYDVLIDHAESALFEKNMTTRGSKQNSFTIVVPTNFYFVFGDLRNNQSIRQNWDFVSPLQILGRPTAVIANINQMRMDIIN